MSFHSKYLTKGVRKKRARCGAIDSALPFFLAVLVLFGMVYGGWTWYRVYRYDTERGQAINEIGPPLPVTAFELTERSGKPFRSADMKGKVWVVTYFFTTCPGECIRLNRNIQVMHNLPELKDVVWVSVTCDPDTDTVETLAKYADSLQADPDRWLFCRADLDYTQRVAKGMKLFLSRKGHQNYAIVIDKAGNTRGMFDATSTSDCERMQKLLEKLVAEDAPQPTGN
ncbi:MAG: SCO family protein [Planctomycetes bacterium]|nr:SCO family protein [Planctomycetota bacterium]